jgi:hypothetical protein
MSLRLVDAVGGGAHDHPGLDDDGAGGLQLGRLFNLDQAHAASGLKGEAGVVAERRDFNAGGLAGLNEQRARWR